VADGVGEHLQPWVHFHEGAFLGVKRSEFLSSVAWLVELTRRLGYDGWMRTRRLSCVSEEGACRSPTADRRTISEARSLSVRNSFNTELKLLGIDLPWTSGARPKIPLV